MPRKTAPPRRRAPTVRANPVALRLLALQEEERRRIARLLHDDLGQTLTAAVLELEYARGAPGDAPAVIDAVVAELRRLLGDARDLSLALRPALIDEEGLGAALGALVARVSALRAVAIDWTCDTGAVRVPPLVALCAFRTAQDALLARASPGARLRLRVAVEGGGLQVEVDGPLPAAAAPREPTIDDRVAAAGGRVLRRRHAGGSRLRAAFPLPVSPGKPPRGRRG